MDNMPTRTTCPAGGAAGARGTASRLRAQRTMMPTMWYRIVRSFCRPGTPQEPQGRITPYPVQPNAAPQPLPEAGATQERTLEAVGCRRLFGHWVTTCMPSKAELAGTV